MKKQKNQRIELHELLRAASNQLRAEFESCRDLPHKGIKGQELEHAVKTFLNHHLPARFKAVSGFILDQTGQVSGHQDVIIYDQLYAPTYRYSESAAIIPNDSVAAVIEVKATLTTQTLLQAMEKAHEVKALVKSKQGITMTMDDSGCLQETSEMEIDGMVLTKVFLFAYQSDISPQAAVESWHKHYHRVPLAMQIDEVVILDRAILTHFFNDPRIHKGS